MIIAIALIVGVWELIARLFIEIPVVLPAASSVGRALIDNFGLYSRELGFTVYEVIVAFVVGFSLGFSAAIGIYYSPLLRRFLYPILIGIRIVPKSAFLPLFIIWFGIGTMSKVALATFSIVLIVLIQALLGLRGVDPGLVEFGRTLGMNERLMFRKVRLPAALPAIMVGVKLSIVHALTLVVIGEMAVARRGVGWIIVDAKARFRTDDMLAGMVAVAAAGLVLYGLGQWVERRTTFWNVEERV